MTYSCIDIVHVCCVLQTHILCTNISIYCIMCLVEYIRIYFVQSHMRCTDTPTYTYIKYIYEYTNIGHLYQIHYHPCYYRTHRILGNCNVSGLFYLDWHVIACSFLNELHWARFYFYIHTYIHPFCLRVNSRSERKINGNVLSRIMPTLNQLVFNERITIISGI